MILQCLIQQFFINEKAEYITCSLDSIKRESIQHIVFPENKNYINNTIENYLNSNSVRRMKIICFGTNRFGRIIDSIMTIHSSVHLDLVLCSPNETVIDLQFDKQRLIKIVNELRHVKNISLHPSYVPPTIRACVLYSDNDKPIFCVVQPYYLFADENSFKLRAEGHSPAMIADCKDEALLNRLVDSFNVEYDRLLTFSSNNI